MGVIIGYYIALGDLLPAIIFGDRAVSYRNKTLLIVGLFLVQPLALLKDISSITKANSASLCGYALVISVIIFEALMSGNLFEIFNFSSPEIIYWDSSRFFSTMSLFAFGFSCHPQIFIVYNDLKSKSGGKIQINRLERIVKTAISYVSYLYITIGLCGYLTFQSQINGNLLTNYPNTKVLCQLMRFAFCFSCIISFPILIFPTRQAIFTLLKQFLPFIGRESGDYANIELEANVANSNDQSYSSTNSASRSKSHSSANNQNQNQGPIQIPNKTFIALSFAVNLPCLFIAIITPDIATMLKLVGSLMGSMIAFILPACITLYKPKSMELEIKRKEEGLGLLDNIVEPHEKISSKHVLRAKILLIVGILVFVLTPIIILMEQDEDIYEKLIEFQDTLVEGN